MAGVAERTAARWRQEGQRLWEAAEDADPSFEPAAIDGDFDGRPFPERLIAFAATCAHVEGSTVLAASRAVMRSDPLRWLERRHRSDWAPSAALSVETRTMPDSTAMVAIQADPALMALANDLLERVQGSSCRKREECRTMRECGPLFPARYRKSGCVCN